MTEAIRQFRSDIRCGGLAWALKILWRDIRIVYWPMARDWRN